MSGYDSISLKPIGYVRNEAKEPRRREWDKVTSDLVIDPDLAECIEGLEEFSHIIVVFWIHESGDSFPRKVHPQGRADLPLSGVLSTRAPHRPNPLGLKVVKLLARRQNLLKVVGLDAIDGSPILDIKPYVPSDSIPDAKYPDWVSKLSK